MATGTLKSGLQQELLDRHMGKGNALFLDCHVDSVAYADYVNNIPDQSWLAGANPTPADSVKHWTQISPN